MMLLLFDSCGELLRREADAGDVVDSAVELRLVCVQQIHSGCDAVVDVDHGQEGLGLQEAVIVTIFKRGEEYL